MYLPLAVSVAPGAAPVATPVEAPQVRSITPVKFGFRSPTAAAFVARSKMLLLAKTTRFRTIVMRLRGFAPVGSALRLPKLRPSTLAYDSRGGGLVGISGTDLLLADPRSLAAAKPSVTRLKISGVGVRDPEGVTFDPVVRRWLVLDAATRSIVAISSKRDGAATSAAIGLGRLGQARLRGLAFNPADRLLYLFATDQHVLYGIDHSGNVHKRYSLRDAAIEQLTGLVFAPSSADARRYSLFVTDAGRPHVLGRLIEFSLNTDGSLPSIVTARWVQTFDSARLRLPLPDPSGIAYDERSDSFLVADSEIEETPFYHGVNLFRMSRAGEILARGTTLAWTNEPSGLAFDKAAVRLFIVDDAKKRLLSLNAGPDGSFGSGDETVSVAKLRPLGIQDPEDVAFDPGNGHVFVSDVYRTPDGEKATRIFDIDPVDGIVGDATDRVTQFDITRYGFTDLEGLGFDPAHGTLIALANSTYQALELTTAGELVRIIDLSTIARQMKLSDIAVAPPPPGGHGGTYWITDRAIDNNSKRHPNQNDGKIYEVQLPS